MYYVQINSIIEYLVFWAEDYRYSSAVDYTGEKGMIGNIVVVKQLH